MPKQVEIITDLTVELEAADFVMSAVDHFREQRKRAGLEVEWRLSEESYYNRTIDYYGGISKVRWGMLHEKAEQVIPKIVQAIFPPDGKWLDAEPDDPLDESQKQVGELVIATLTDQLRDINAQGKMIGTVRNLVTYGTVFTKVFWEHRVKERFKRNKDNVREKFWETTFDNPNFYTPSIWNIYADIKDEDLEGLLIEEIDKDYQDLWENRVRTETEDGQEVRRGIYKNVAKTKEWSNPKVEETAKQGSERSKGLNKHEFGIHENKVRIFECWGKIPLWFLTKSVEDKEKKLTVDGLIVVAVSGENDAKVTLRVSDNPFDHQEKPYQRSRYIAIPGKLYGLGLFTTNISIEAYANTLLNQDMDNRTFNLRPKWLIDRAARVNPASLKDQAEQIIETDLVGGIQPLRPEDFTVQTLGMLNFVSGLIDEGTGASALLGGTPGGNSLERTASGIATVTQSALDRFELVVVTFEEELLQSFLFQIWALNQQFLPKGKSVRGFPRVKPRDIPLPKINFSGVKGIAERNFLMNETTNVLNILDKYTQFGIDPVPVVFESLRLRGFERLIPEIDKRPSQESLLEQTPEGEVQLLRFGQKVRVDIDDPHDAFIAAYRGLLAEPDLAPNIVANTEAALGKRLILKELQRNPKVLAEIADRANLGSG